MSTEDNKALIRRFYEEVFNKRNLGAIDDFYAPDHTLPPGLPVSLEGTKQAIDTMLKGFPVLLFRWSDCYSSDSNANDVKELHDKLADLTDDELKEISIVPIGSRLEQGSSQTVL